MIWLLLGTPSLEQTITALLVGLALLVIAFGFLCAHSQSLREECKATGHQWRCEGTGYECQRCGDVISTWSKR